MIGDKRGAEETGTVIWLIVGAIVAFVIGYFVYDTFSTINTSMDALNVENKAMIFSCQSTLSLAKTDEDKFAKYCGSFAYPAEYGGEMGFVNCEFLARNKVVAYTEQEVPKTVSEKCTATVSDKLAYNKCLEFNNTRKDDTSNWVEYVNGVKCNRKIVYTMYTRLINDKPAENGYVVEFASL